MSQGKEKPPCGGPIPTAMLRGRSHQPLAGGSRGNPIPIACQTTGGAKQGQQDDVRVLALSLSIRPLSAMLASPGKAGDTATR